MGNTKRDYKGQTWQKVGQGDLKNRSQVRKSSVMTGGNKILSSFNSCPRYEFFSISKEKNYGELFWAPKRQGFPMIKERLNYLIIWYSVRCIYITASKDGRSSTLNDIADVPLLFLSVVYYEGQKGVARTPYRGIFYFSYRVESKNYFPYSLLTSNHILRAAQNLSCAKRIPAAHVMFVPVLKKN